MTLIFFLVGFFSGAHFGAMVDRYFEHPNPRNEKNVIEAAIYVVIAILLAILFRIIVS